MSAAADRLGKWLAIGGAVAVVVLVASAIVATGSPAEQRRMRIDAGRIEDLERIQVYADAWFTHHGQVSPDLDSIAKQPGADVRIDDRDGRGRYGYERIDATHYRLCAEFDTDTARTRSEEYPANMPAWSHPAGRHCFTLVAKKTKPENDY